MKPFHCSQVSRGIAGVQHAGEEKLVLKADVILTPTAAMFTSHLHSNKQPPFKSERLQEVATKCPEEVYL